MKDFLELRYNCKVIDWFDSWYWTFRYKGHLFYLGLLFPQFCDCKNGYDYYILYCDNKILTRHGLLESCLALIDNYD